MASICLVGIVRDERNNLPNLFASVRHLLDAIVLTDTGSTDETIPYVKKYLEDQKLLGEIISSTWKGFIASRTESFVNAEGFLKKFDIRQKKKRTWYFMLMDADDIAYGHNADDIPNGLPQIDKSTLTEIGYMIKKFQDISNLKIYSFYWLLRMEQGKKWTWRRRIHEYPVLDGKDITCPAVPGCYVHSGRRGFRSRNPYLYADDAAEAVKEYIDNKDAWSAYHVGQSYKDQGLWMLAIPMYKEVSRIDPYCHFAYLASYEILRYLVYNLPSLKDQVSKDKQLAKITKRAIKTIEINPKRAEAPYLFLKAYRIMEKHNLGYAFGRAFLGLTPDLNAEAVYVLDYTVRIYDEMAICAAAINQRKEAIEWLQIALKEKRMPDDLRKRLISNLYRVQTANGKVTLPAEGEKFEAIEEETPAETVLKRLLKDGKYEAIVQKLASKENSCFSSYLLAAAYYGLNKHEEALVEVEKVLDKGKCTPDLLDLVTSLREKILTPRFKKYTNYPKEIVDQLTNADYSDAQVTFTMTTCKRYDLFVQTMNSFLQCCTEKHLIREWIVIDDNSSADDRQKMRELYPFVNFIFKNFKHKGHPISMEILRRTVKTKYMLHVEDDWNFVLPFPLISRAADVLETDSKCHTVCFNRNSAELLSEHRTDVGEERWSKGGCRYYEHTPGQGKYGYWPSFSLRPGLFKTTSLNSIGTFLLAGQFEHAYGKKAEALGLKLAFLPGIYAQTTGKLIAEKGTNSYTLNNEIQNGFNPATVPTSLTLPFVSDEKRAALRTKIETVEKLEEAGLLEKLLDEVGDSPIRAFILPRIRAMLKLGKPETLTEIERCLLSVPCSDETLRELGRLKELLVGEFLLDYPEEKLKNTKFEGQEIIVGIRLTKLSLLERTLNSFLNTCQDLEKVGRWIVVADSQELALEAKEKYPFLDRIVRSEAEKNSMVPLEMLRNWIKTKYLLYLEEGWIFSSKIPYFTIALDILNQNPKYGQVLLNRNYALKFNEYEIETGPEKWTPIRRYYEHVYGMGKHGHWPHFSIQPAIHNMQVLEDIGAFPFSVNYEEDYAKRYMEKGYKTVFVPLITCMKDVNPKLPTEKIRVKSFCINLDRRKDRWEAVKKEFEREKWPVSRFSAVDGKELILTQAQARMFAGNEFHDRRSVIGCAMSHFELWNMLSDDPDADAYLIFEDDITLAKNFKFKLQKVLNQVQDQDVVYLAYHIWGDKQTSEYINPMAPDVTLEDMKITSYWKLREFSPGGAQSYFLSKKAALFLLDKAETEGMKKANDDFINFYHASLKIWHCKPHLTSSEFCDFRGGNKPTTDTNIQNDLEKVKVRELPKAKSLIINLKRREDRWTKLNPILSQFKNVERFEAVDGKTVTLNTKEKKMFEGNNHNWRVGIIGCALSHLRIWEKLVKDKDAEVYFVYEDDIELSVRFSDKINSLLDNYNGQEFIFLANTIASGHRTSQTHDLSSIGFNVTRWKYSPTCYGGTQGYMISKSGAKKLLKVVYEKGVKRAIDGFLLDNLPSLDTWECLPHLLFTEYYQDGKTDIDTDIQKDFTSVPH